MKRLVTLVLIVSAAVAAATALAGERAYTDGAGDSGTAPDVTTVTVSDSNGFLAFKIAGNLVPSTSFDILVDVDRNGSTGSQTGDELWISVFQEPDGKTYWDAERWDGSKWADTNFDVDSRAFAGRHELGFRAADAGINGTFDFMVMSFKMLADGIEASDRAPDSVVPWTYELTAQQQTTTAARATLGQVRLVPARPVAGKPVTIRVPVRVGATGQPLTSGTATCSARVNGRQLRGTAGIVNGFATCRLVLPKRSSGTLARGSLAVGTGAQAVTKRFSFRIA